MDKIKTLVGIALMALLFQTPECYVTNKTNIQYRKAETLSEYLIVKDLNHAENYQSFDKQKNNFYL